LARPLDGTKLHWSFVSIRLALTHLGEPTTPPPVSPARSPPLWEAFDWDQTPAFDPAEAESESEIDFDQTVNW
jgi:hypothetical protein